MDDASSSSPDGEISAPFISDIEVADFFMVLSPVLVYVSKQPIWYELSWYKPTSFTESTLGKQYFLKGISFQSNMGYVEYLTTDPNKATILIYTCPPR